MGLVHQGWVFHGLLPGRTCTAGSDGNSRSTRHPSSSNAHVTLARSSGPRPINSTSACEPTTSDVIRWGSKRITNRDGTIIASGAIVLPLAALYRCARSARFSRVRFDRSANAAFAAEGSPLTTRIRSMNSRTAPSGVAFIGRRLHAAPIVAMRRRHVMIKNRPSDITAPR